MSLSNILKKTINDYYKKELDTIKDKMEKFIDKNIKDIHNNFTKEESYKKIKYLVNILEEKYGPENISFNLDLRTWRNREKIKENIEYQKLKEEFDVCYLEHKNLLITLDSNRKDSQVYKNALNKFMIKLEEKKND